MEENADPNNDFLFQSNAKHERKETTVVPRLLLVFLVRFPDEG